MINEATTTLQTVRADAMMAMFIRPQQQVLFDTQLASGML